MLPPSFLRGCCVLPMQNDLHLRQVALCVTHSALHLPPHAHLPSTRHLEEQLHGLSSKSDDTRSSLVLKDRSALNISPRLEQRLQAIRTLTQFVLCFFNVFVMSLCVFAFQNLDMLIRK